MVNVEYVRYLEEGVWTVVDNVRLGKTDKYTVIKRDKSDLTIDRVYERQDGNYGLLEDGYKFELGEGDMSMYELEFRINELVGEGREVSYFKKEDVESDVVKHVKYINGKKLFPDIPF